MVALLVDIGQFVIRLHEWLVAPVCEVEVHIKKVDDLFVSFDCVRFERWQTSCSGLVQAMETWKVMECKNFVFKAWKVMKFNFRS